MTKWASRSFCRTRVALLTAINEKIVRGDEFYAGGKRMTVDSAALELVRSLPQIEQPATERLTECDFKPRLDPAASDPLRLSCRPPRIILWPIYLQ